MCCTSPRPAAGGGWGGGGFVGGRGQHPAAVVKPYQVSSSNTISNQKKREERKKWRTDIPNPRTFRRQLDVSLCSRRLSDGCRVTHLSEEHSALESSSAEGGLALKCKMSSVVEIFISEALCVSYFHEAGVQGTELGAETVVFDSHQVFNQSRRFAHNSEKIPADRPPYVSLAMGYHFH